MLLIMKETLQPFFFFSGASLVQEILTIPEGSRSIRLTSKGPNFLGFRGTITWSSLQWNPPPTDFGEYQLGDSLVRYTTLQSGRERVYIDGPLTEPVKVFVSIEHILHPTRPNNDNIFKFKYTNLLTYLAA